MKISLDVFETDNIIKLIIGQTTQIGMQTFESFLRFFSVIRINSYTFTLML
jgi:hypothetical protein